MAHQLYVLQVLTFNLLEERMMTKMDPNDQASAGWCQALSGFVAVAHLCLPTVSPAYIFLVVPPDLCVLLGVPQDQPAPSSDSPLEAVCQGWT